MKRSEVPLETKFRYIAMALQFPSNKTDVIGVACQFSVNPKLKREDFNDIINLRIKDVLTSIEIKNLANKTNN